MKFSVKCLLSGVLICFTLCSCNNKKAIQNDLPVVIGEQNKSGISMPIDRDEKYIVVEPTKSELDEILSRLNYILSMFHEDYDSEHDNIYEYLFDYDHMEYVEPLYDEEVKKYIAPPLCYYNDNILNPRWYISIKENDPLGKYPEIPDGILDENGETDYDFVDVYLKDHHWLDAITGHIKYSGEYIDWLVEGVWNGRVQHETFFTFDDGSRCYYHNGNYYLPEHEIGGRGGGVFYAPIEESLTPIGDGKYQLNYTVVNDIDEPEGIATAVVALKESDNGFRFWSIYSIDFDRCD